MRVGVVLPWTQNRIVLQQSVEHIQCLARRARNYPSAENTVLVGGVRKNRDRPLIVAKISRIKGGQQ